MWADFGNFHYINFHLIGNFHYTTDWHALSLINHGDASDREDIDEWDWKSMLEDDDQDDDEYCNTSDNDELVTLLLHL